MNKTRRDTPACLFASAHGTRYHGPMEEWGKILVSAQFACIAAIALMGRLWPLGWLPGFFVVTGAVLAGAALWAMRLSAYRFRPEPAEKAILVMEGPYRTIRHPMYTALLLVAGGVVVNRFSTEGAIGLVVLVVVLVLKIRYEERLLNDKFPAYRDYMAKTWRIAPRLW